MAEDNNSKLQQILSELPRDKRDILEGHIASLPEDKRDAFIAEVIKEYESIKKAAGKSAPESPKETTEENKPEAESKPAVEATPEVELKPEEETKAEPESEPAKDPGQGILDLDFVNSENTAPSIPLEPIAEDFDLPSIKKEESEALSPAPAENKKSGRPSNKEMDAIFNGPVHTRRRSGSPVAAIIFTVLGLLVAGGIVFAIMLFKNPAFAPIAAKLGINPVTSETQTEVTTTETSETETTTETTEAPTTTSETTPEPTPEPTPIPTPTQVPLKSNAPNLKGIKVVIDPGHQEKTDYTKEPFKKGVTTGKPRCTSGTVGVSTKQKEYELTLETAFMLKDYLEQCGATVVMTRTENNVNLSNRQRANIAVKAKPTLFIRLHADASTNKKVKGVRVYIPRGGKYNKIAAANKLGKLVAAAGKTTFRGSKATNQYTGLNYAYSIRSYQIILGYLSNKEDDERLADPNNRYEMVAAIANFCSSFKKK